MLGTMPITVRVVPDNNRKRPAPHITRRDHEDVSIPFAKRLHTSECGTLGNGDSNSLASKLNGRLVGVYPNGVRVCQLNGSADCLVRRKANLDAQVALKLILTESPPASPNRLETVTHREREIEKMESHNGYQSHKSLQSINGCSASNPEASPSSPAFHISRSLETSPVASPKYRLSPQRLFDSKIESEGHGAPVAHFYQQGKLKQPEIHLVKHQSKKKKHKSSQPKSSSVVKDGFVRRMASLNASACVSAMMEPSKKNITRHNGSVTKSTAISSTSPLNADPRKRSFHQNGLKMFNPSENLATTCTHDQLPTSQQASLIKHSPFPDNLHMEENEDDVLSASPVVEPCSLENMPFVSIGLLHNGGTVHPDTRVFYKSDKSLTLPERIIPILVPSKMESVRKAKRRAESIGVRKIARKKTRAANNGWYPLGDPIKSIQLKKGSSKVVRKYYIGIKRRNEEIFVRNSITVSSGDPDHSIPYVAKIASIWQETDHRLMMTLFWYYRPAEVDLTKSVSGITTPDFQEKEILASQHHDDNSVACIEEKCYVLGLQQFCRYSSSVKKTCGSNTKSVIPELPLTLTSYQDSSLSGSEEELDVQTTNYSSDLCTVPTLKELHGVEDDLVYVCYRGYNYIAGKLATKPRVKF